jgi:invasion protein IalB
MPFATRLARMRGTVGLAAVGFALGTGVPMLALAQAQQPQQQKPQQTQAQQKPQQKPAQPAQPAQPTPQGQPAQAGQQAGTGPTIVQVKPEPSQTDWTKVCGKDQGQNAEVCYTTRDFVSDQGQPVLAAAVYDIKGPQPQRVVRFLMPLGLLLKPGIRFAVDQGQPTPGGYAICFPNGCFAEASIKDDTINALKKGTNLNISVQNQAGREVTFAVPLAGFGKAFDGAPIDPKVLEEQQKKLQEELQKKSDELRKRLEEGQANAAPAPTR